jgi:hypothetical protein
MANNPYLFNCALAGVTGGSQERFLNAEADYTQLLLAAQVFATVVDSLIPAIDPPGATSADGAALQSIVQGVMAGRYVSSTNPDDYVVVGQAIATLFSETQGNLDPAGSGPAPGGITTDDVTNVSSVAGGTGSCSTALDYLQEQLDNLTTDEVVSNSTVPETLGPTASDALDWLYSQVTPLFSERWADSQTLVPENLRTGFIGAPYEEAAQAITGGPTIVHVSPGNYIDDIDTSTNIAIVSSVGSDILSPTIMGDIITHGLTIYLKGLNITGDIDMTGSEPQTGHLEADSVYFVGGDTVCARATLNNCRFFTAFPITFETLGEIAPVGIDCVSCDLSGLTMKCKNLIARLKICEIGPGFTFEFTSGDPGELQVDTYTNQRLTDAGFGGPINGSLVVVG